MYLDYHQATQAIKYQYIVEPLAYLALVCGRISFAVSLIKIVGVTKVRRWLLYSLIVGQVVVNLVMAGVQLGQCKPTAKYWDRAIQGKCMDPRVMEYTGYVQSGRLVRCSDTCAGSVLS